MGVAASCQTDVGLCTTQPLMRSLPIGAACTSSDFTSGACNCDFDPTTNAGFCTTVCVVGGTPCPTGWVCDSGEPTVVNLGNGNIPITTQTPGLAGTCLPACITGAAATTSAAVMLDGGADGAVMESADAGDAPTDAASPAPLDAGGDAAIDAASASAPEAGVDAAPVLDSGTYGVTCPAGSTCTPGTVAGPDCLP